MRGVPDDWPGRLTDADIDAIVAHLRAGQYLDEYLRPLLFRQPKEMELGYAAKEPKSRVLADTMGVPLQAVKRFGQAPQEGWTNKLVIGDNLQVLKTLLDMRSRGELVNADGTHGIRCCYIDPPFATRQEFRGNRGQRAYRDRIAGAAFVEFLRKRLVFISELLADDGSLWVHLDARKVHYVKVVLDELFGEHNFRNEVVWKRTSAHSDAAVLGVVHETLLLYTKSADFVWNPQYVPYEEWYVEQYYRYDDPDGRKFMSGDLSAAGLSGGGYDYVWNGHRREWRVPPDTMKRLDDEKRVFYTRNGMPRLKRYLDESKGQPLSDVWTDVLPIVSWSTEREGYPTQKPERLLERVITASSNEGDLVLDAFAGSGTTAIVAERMNRRWVAVDSGKFAAYVTQRRLLALGESDMDVAPFDLCSAGLYDNAQLEALSFEGFESFCLDLFDCRAAEHRIGGVQMAGTRRGEPVHFFPFKATDGLMGREYIDSLHSRLKGKHAGAFYIVAPVSHCDPGLFEDVITIGRIMFFVLRVPYSVIEALHGRRFQLIDQPFSEKLLNDPMEAFGFDFMQMPDVDASYVLDGDVLRGSVTSFHRGGLDPDDFDGLDEAGRLDLAMVMVDRDYQEDGHFRLSDYFFGDTLEDAAWRFELPAAECGKTVFVVYLDTHGNERRETLELAAIPKAKAVPKKRTTKAQA